MELTCNVYPWSVNFEYALIQKKRDPLSNIKYHLSFNLSFKTEVTYNIVNIANRVYKGLISLKSYFKINVLIKKVLLSNFFLHLICYNIFEWFIDNWGNTKTERWGQLTNNIQWKWIIYIYENLAFQIAPLKVWLAINEMS